MKRSTRFTLNLLAMSAIALVGSMPVFVERAFADPIEVYEDFPRTTQFISRPWQETPTLLSLSYLRGKKIEPGHFRMYLSKNVTLKALNNHWNGQEQGSAVIMSICSERPDGDWFYRNVKKVPLHWDGRGFMTEPLTVIFDYTDRTTSYRCYQEVAVEVDGIWHVDPVSGGHNFRYDMANPTIN